MEYRVICTCPYVQNSSTIFPKKLVLEVQLTLDNPQSVREQLIELKQAEKQLRTIKQEVVAQIKEINQQSKQIGLDEVASLGLHLMGKHRIARKVNRQGNRMERRNKKAALQPQIRMRELIDNYLFESDRLKLMAKEYLQKQEKV